MERVTGLFGSSSEEEAKSQETEFKTAQEAGEKVLETREEKLVSTVSEISVAGARPVGVPFETEQKHNEKTTHSSRRSLDGPEKIPID